MLFVNEYIEAMINYQRKLCNTKLNSRTTIIVACKVHSD